MRIFSKKMLDLAFSEFDKDKIMKELLTMKPEKQLEYLRNKGKNLKTTVNWQEMSTKAHNQAFTVAGIHSADMLKAIYDKLEEAKKKGQTLTEFLEDTEELRKLTKLTENRLKVVYETNLNIAYAKGQYEHQQRLGKSGIRPYLKYIASTSAEKNDFHRQFYGKVLRYDDPFWSTFYPPSRFGCKCSVRALSEKEVEKEGIKIENGNDILELLSKDNEFKKQLDKTKKDGLKITEDYKPDLSQYPDKVKEDLINMFSKILFKELSNEEYKDISVNYLETLKPEVKDCIKEYAGEAYDKYNRVLRGTNDDQSLTDEYIKKTNTIIEGDLSYELNHSILLYRGMFFPEGFTNDYLNILKDLESGIFIEKAFLSASSSKDISLSYANINNDRADSIFMTIKVGKGSKLGVASDFEKEFLFRPNSSFYVTNLIKEKKVKTDMTKITGKKPVERDVETLYATLIYYPKE